MALRTVGCSSLCRHRRALLDTLPRTCQRARTLRSCTWCMHWCRRCMCGNCRPLARILEAARTAGCSCLCLHWWCRTGTLQCSDLRARTHHCGTSCMQCCRRCTCGNHLSWQCMQLMLGRCSHLRHQCHSLRTASQSFRCLHSWYQTGMPRCSCLRAERRHSCIRRTRCCHCCRCGSRLPLRCMHGGCSHLCSQARPCRPSNRSRSRIRVPPRCTCPPGPQTLALLCTTLRPPCS